MLWQSCGNNMSDETNFLVFCTESYKNHRSQKGRQVYELFVKYGVYDYLRSNYDILHTMGYQYINSDIDAYLENHIPTVSL